MKLNTKLIMTSARRSLIFLFSYELAILMMWLCGYDTFLSIHIKAWQMDIVTLILVVTVLRFLWLMRNKTPNFNNRPPKY